MRDCFYKYPLAVGKGEPENFVLCRYLPIFKKGVVRDIISRTFSTPGWVIDLFGSSPGMAFEVAALGYKILILLNNPIVGLIAQLPALNVSQRNVNQIIELLAKSRVRGDRIETHLLHLYESDCLHCGAKVFVSEYIWDDNIGKPIQKKYFCSSCDKEFIDSTTPLDIEKSLKYRNAKVHRARALSRTVRPDDKHRGFVEQVLLAYTDRALYAINIILDFYESLDLEIEEKKIFALLCVELFDRISKLWRPSLPTYHPKRIKVPKLYLEKNVWYELLKVGEDINCNYDEIEVTTYPNMPKKNGICLVFRKNIDIRSALDSMDIQGVITSYPRINQAFWNFSAIWSVWLLGKSGRDYFNDVAARQAYSWQWYINAISHYISLIRPSLPDDTIIVNLLAENESDFALSTLIASVNADFRFDGLAYCDDDRQVQYYYRTSSLSKNQFKSKDAMAFIFADILATYNQPIDYFRASTIVAPIMVEKMKGTKDINLIKGGIDSFLASHPSRLLLTKNEDRVKGDYWWVHAEDKTMWHDQVENTIYNLLKDKQSIHYEDLEKYVYNQFPGILSPTKEYIKLCLLSYATLSKNTDDRWMIKEQDKPHNRDRELSKFIRHLQKISNKLNFEVKLSQNSSGLKVVFANRESEPVGILFFMYTTSITDIIFRFRELAIPRYVIIPGSRANLVAYRRQNNAAIDEMLIQKQVIFIKYRQFRRLLTKSSIKLDDLHELASLDPIMYDKNQMRLL